ncbi:MAG TPA: putative glycoside hydrolase [Bryobacteraceae bacterium]|nr:putative glycoside hydrolase [Bryobacteraceae bacterium]
MRLLNQTEFSDSIRHVRALNPNVVILVDCDSESVYQAAAPSSGNVDLSDQLRLGIPDVWYLRDSKGNYPVNGSYALSRYANFSPFAPVIGGQTFFSYLHNWLDTSVFTSGLWDGVFFDGLVAREDSLPNASNPALFDVDYERTGIRDETIAWVSDMARGATMEMLRQFRNSHGEQQLIISNSGSMPELSLAPYVNGYTFECFDQQLPALPEQAVFTPDTWRRALDVYLAADASTRLPRINIIEGCGKSPGYASGDGYAGGQLSSVPSAEDLQRHRVALGTALLGDGFYSYDLHDPSSPPLWYDEYSVNPNGVAVEDMSRKGYLGQALSKATELSGPPSVVFEETFEQASPSHTPGVSVSHDPGEVISGTASLVLDNQDHTKTGPVIASMVTNLQLSSSSSYLLTFDWRILETVEWYFNAGAGGGGSALFPGPASEVVAGDGGTHHVPISVVSSNPLSIYFTIGAAGKVAIDNIRITQNGTGPWRRDFENGFVLVNPFDDPHTFSAADLAGALNRTGIRRIRGTQAPDVNNGQRVTGSLTLAAFDAVILLADHIDAPPRSTAPPTVNSVATASAFGASTSIAPGSYIEIYGSNLAATTRTWSAADFNGTAAPTSLDNVSVLVGGRPAYISYVSPSQINALVSSDAAIGPMQVVVSSPAGTSVPYMVNVQATEPGLLAPPAFKLGGKQYAAALLPDNQTFVLPPGAISGVLSRPAKPGETIVIYGAGFGPATPNLRAGTLVGAANSLTNPLQIYIAGTPATLLYDGLAPGQTGVYQFNVVVPDVPDGTLPLTFNLGGLPGTQTLYIAVQR